MLEKCILALASRASSAGDDDFKQIEEVRGGWRAEPRAARCSPLSRLLPAVDPAQHNPPPHQPCCPLLTAAACHLPLVLQALTAVTEAAAGALYELATSQYGSFVARRLLCVLSGRDVAPAAPGKKQAPAPDAGAGAGSRRGARSWLLVTQTGDRARHTEQAGYCATRNGPLFGTGAAAKAELGKPKAGARERGGRAFGRARREEC